MKGEETGETYGKTGSETVGADGESRWLFNGFLIFVDGRVFFCFLSPKHHFWLGGSCVIHWPFTLSLLPHFLHHAGFCCTNFEDPGSPKLRMVSWNLNTLRFISVIGHPNRSSSDVHYYIPRVRQFPHPPQNPSTVFHRGNHGLQVHFAGRSIPCLHPTFRWSDDEFVVSSRPL